MAAGSNASVIERCGTVADIGVQYRPTQPRRKIRALLVDDSDSDCDLFQTVFQPFEANAELYIANAGSKALEYLWNAQNRKFGLPAHIIFISQKLRDFDAIEILGILKRDQILRVIPAIVLVSAADISKSNLDPIYGQNAGSIVVKPIRLDSYLWQLRIVLNYWLNKVQLPFMNYQPTFDTGG